MNPPYGMVTIPPAGLSLGVVAEIQIGQDQLMQAIHSAEVLLKPTRQARCCVAGKLTESSWQGGYTNINSKLQDLNHFKCTTGVPPLTTHSHNRIPAVTVWLTSLNDVNKTIQFPGGVGFSTRTRDLQQLEELRRIRNIVFPIIEAPVGGWGFIHSTQSKAASSKLVTSSWITGCMLKECGTLHHDHDCTLQNRIQNEKMVERKLTSQAVSSCSKPDHRSPPWRARQSTSKVPPVKGTAGVNRRLPSWNQPKITGYDFLMLDESALQTLLSPIACNGNL